MPEKLSENIYFFIDDKVEKVEQADYGAKATAISYQWEEETNTYGKWKIPVLNWAFDLGKDGMPTLRIPELVSGDRVPLNFNASAMLGANTYGPCFLIPYESTVDEIEAMCK